MESRPAARRLFFALWPPDALKEHIAAETREAVERSGGRIVPTGNLHVTVLFLGSVADERMPLVEEAGTAVAAAPFTIEFEQLEVWPGANVLCWTARRTPSELRHLHQQLLDALSKAGFAFRPQKFRAHVTLARDVRAPRSKAPFKSLRWSAQDFVLVESTMTKTGSRYDVIARWKLRAEQGSV